MAKRGRKPIANALRKKKRLAVRLLDSQVLALEEIADREEITASDLVREAVDSVIDKYSRHKPKEGKRHGS
jgi:hypothetical protein